MSAPEQLSPDIEKLWDTNESFQAIQAARQADQQPDPADVENFINGIGVYQKLRPVISQMLAAEVEISEEAKGVAVYDALAEAERGDDETAICLRALDKLSLVLVPVTDVSDVQAVEQETAESAKTKYPPLPAEVFERVKRDDPDALERVVAHYINFVRHTAYKIARGLPQRTSAIDVNDLIQEGVLAVMRSAKLFEPDRGTSFLGYAGKGIRRSMRNHIDDMGSTVRIPRHTGQKLRALERLNWQRRAQQRPLLSPAEIAEMFDVDPSLTWDSPYISVGTLRHAQMLSAYMGSIDIGYSPQADTSPGNEYVLDHTQGMTNLVTADPQTVEQEALRTPLRTALEHELAELSDEERKILSYRFSLDDGGQPRTLAETSKVFGIAENHIRSTEGKALTRLRYPKDRPPFDSLLD